ncbi:MAG: bifunctional 4-hydroxy-2-oxoglutarate aldolase/2-dehydro-3-deoxy-phosphogluconate aldolase [Deltaproteobacteria bacterium]
MKPIEIIMKNKIVAVIRAESAARAVELADWCASGGIKIIEITFSFPEAAAAIRDLSGRGDILVAAGTVLDVATAKLAARSGAKFIVSPHTDADIINFAKSEGLAVASGALTSNEIVGAWKLGADFVKIFPVKSVGGASYIKAIKEPLPFVNVMTTGGVTTENFLEYIQHGASVVGIASSFFGGGELSSHLVSGRAKLAVDKLAALNL